METAPGPQHELQQAGAVPAPGGSAAGKGGDIPLRRMRSKGPALGQPVLSQPLTAPSEPLEDGKTDDQPMAVNPQQQLQLVDPLPSQRQIVFKCYFCCGFDFMT